MFAYINGFLEDVTVDNAVIDVNGFGINVRISADTASKLPGIGEQVRLYTYTYVKEDAFLLYGFLSRSDLEMFKLCITVSGIGPKGALAILSVMDADSLRFAIMSGDAKAISKAPGVGTRTAQRLILELKDKIYIDDTLISREIAAGGAEGILTAGSLHIDSEKKKEAVEALVALGYGQAESLKAVNAIEDVEAMDSGAILKAALKKLFQGMRATTMSRRMIETNITEEDIKLEGSLRPQTLDDYIGQSKIKENLKVYITAAKQRGDALDHVLFYGPPGLGKTTLAGIIANEMGVHMKVTSGPAIEKPGEMAAILNNLEEGDLLFVDEIHRLNRQVEEVLYPAMEDYCIDIMIGKGSSARSVRLELPKFTLVGATTRAGLLTAPLRDRFGMIHHLEFYTIEELQQIIMHSAGILDVEIEPAGAKEMARRSRGTPRLANRILKRVRDFAQVKYDGIITEEVARTALDLMDVDKMGLDHIDRNILVTIIEKFNGGPVGLDTLAAAIGEDAGTIEDVYEPYLIKNGFLSRTPKGRVVTDLTYRHLGLKL